MLRIRVLLCALLACTALGGAALDTSEAFASHSQADFFEASTQLLKPKTREHAVAQMKHLGVKAVRIELHWQDVAPGANSATKPSFEATNPGLYAWGAYDWAIDKAHELGWKVLLTVTSPVPRWATSNHRAPYDTSPNARDFKEFMTAVGRHYGSQVALYAIWNEPNDAAFLLPQFNANGQPVSPRIYRGLYQEGYAGLQAAGMAHPNVLIGETAPSGYDSLSRRKIREERHEIHDVAPLAFLRGMLCLNANYRKAGSCGPLHASGYAHHAYSNRLGPYYRPSGRDEVMIGVLPRLENALNLAARAGAINGGLPIYLTEFGVQSKPNRYLGVSPAKQAEYDAIAEYIAWRDPRVAAFSQYLLRDDPVGGAPGSGARGGYVGFQSGLEYVNGQPKPLYDAWPVPLAVFKTGGRYSLWGLVRPAAGVTRVKILVKTGGSRKYRVLKTVQTDSLGYWSFSSSTPGTSWRVSWTSPSGVKYEGPPIGANRPV
ncbi:MAG TPA: cellulase family glycosylhydrolase [Solirubrobacteraceae bacterium]|nr:cellulase family glycosylhydrolase [Solirubrobacteraceae bacterium]